MLKQVPASDHVVAVSVDGKVSGESIKKYQSILKEKLQQHAQIGVYVDLSHLTDMSSNALLEGTKADIELLSHLKQLSRCALVSDKEWVQAVVSFAQQIVPVLDMRVFPSDQREEALKWASDIPQTSAPRSPAIRFLPTTMDNVLAFEIDGMITADEMPGVIKKLEHCYAAHDKVRLLNRMTHFGGFDPSIFMQSGFLPMKLSSIEKVERYAIVGAPNWMRKIVDVINPYFPNISMQTFTADEESGAWAWIGADPAE